MILVTSKRLSDVAHLHMQLLFFQDGGNRYCHWSLWKNNCSSLTIGAKSKQRDFTQKKTLFYSCPVFTQMSVTVVFSRTQMQAKNKAGREVHCVIYQNCPPRKSTWAAVES